MTICSILFLISSILFLFLSTNSFNFSSLVSIISLNFLITSSISLIFEFEKWLSFIVLISSPELLPSELPLCYIFIIFLISLFFLSILFLNTLNKEFNVATVLSRFSIFPLFSSILKFNNSALNGLNFLNLYLYLSIFEYFHLYLISEFYLRKFLYLIYLFFYIIFYDFI